MACLDTKGHYPPMSPRLSFSNDFVQSHHPASTTQHQNTPPNISPSHDFEFSNPNNQSMTAADELFFNGKLLPTLRDELLLDDDDDEDLPPKGLPKWKEFLSLKRSVDGRCNNNNQGKLPKLAVDHKPHLPI